MKDSYTFDRDAEGLTVAYDKHIARLRPHLRPLRPRVVPRRVRRRDDGRHRRARVHGAVRRRARTTSRWRPATPPTSRSPARRPSRRSCRRRWPRPRRCTRPGRRRSTTVAGPLGVPAGALLKAFPVVDRRPRPGASCCVRGDHRVNEIKLAQRARRARSARPTPRRSSERIGPPGFIGPVGATCRSLLDDGRRAAAATSSAPTAPDHHLRGVEPGRDFALRARRRAHASRPATRVDGHPIRIEPAIEVGNIFKLGTRYSEPLGATYLDETGREQLDLDGLLRHRPGAHRRRRGRAVRRRAAGSPGRAAIAPFDVELVGARQAGHATSATPPRPLRGAARRPGSRSLYDDRDAGPGEKFADAELLGCPLRADGRPALAGVGRGRGAGRGAGARRAAACRSRAPREAVAELWREPPVERRQPPAPARRSIARARRRRRRCAGAPLHPWTIPNAIGFVAPRADPGVPRRSRCSSDDGTDALPAIALRVDRLGDYADGIAARADRPVQPPRRAARPGRRPPARHRRRRRLLVLRAAAALGAGARARRARAADARARAATRCAAAWSCAINWPGRLAVVADAWAALLRDAAASATLGEVLLVRRARARARGDGAVRPRRRGAQLRARPSSSA